MEIFNALYGAFLGDNLTWTIVGSVLVFLALGYVGARLWVWSLALAALLIGLKAPLPCLSLYIVLAAIFNIFLLRRLLISRPLMKLMKGFMPKISATERVALEAGVVWVEKDLFSGRPNFGKLLNEPYPQLTLEEKKFLEGPLNDLCESLNDWEIWQNKDISPKSWDLIKKGKFLGMIVSKKYGGLGVSNYLASSVLQKLASRSATGCITVMVPNSLGPAELISHYGTQKQKDELLPKLASGEHIPCFGLTEPTAGSDAGGMKATGILFKDHDGSLKIKMNWDKRWITLAAISTLLGIAFKLKDPDNLLKTGNSEIGITCALIPSNLPGVVVGRRHDPISVPFYNCPTQGHDVIIPVDYIVGGLEGAGRGWQMLMECLAAGRGVSLPAQSVGGVKLCTRVASAHCVIRKQFGISIGNFEGVREPLGRIAGLTYLMEANRVFTCGGLDKGIKPPVITAIAKYNQTELGRKVLQDAMDVVGGQGISRGPRHLFANMYIGAPIGITVEGANILTRTLMIFGQGALRAHPYAFKEVDSIDKKDSKGFDQAFWGHVGHVVRNSFRAVLLSVTRGLLTSAPVGGPTSKYYRRLSWTSASFAILADLAMGGLGGTLKSRQMVTGRLADILSWMYLGFSALRRYEAEGRRKEDLPLIHFAMQYAFTEIQKAFDGLYRNIALPGLGWFFAGPVRLWSQLNSLGNGVSDKILNQIATLIQKDGEQRDRLTDGIYYSKTVGDALNRIDTTFKTISQADKILGKIKKAVKARQLPKKKMGPSLIKEAV